MESSRPSFSRPPGLSPPTNPPVMSKLPPLRYLSPETRRAACTHLTMSRMFFTSYVFKCMLCHRIPTNGYIWWCTQDHGGWLPDVAYGAKKNPARDVALDIEREDEVGLKPWMLKAIEQGCYTSDQIGIIKGQRLAVRETISRVEKEYAGTVLHFESKQDVPKPVSNSEPLTSLSSPPSMIGDDVITLPPVGPNLHLPHKSHQHLHEQDDDQKHKAMTGNGTGVVGNDEQSSGEEHAPTGTPDSSSTESHGSEHTLSPSPEMHETHPIPRANTPAPAIRSAHNALTAALHHTCNPGTDGSLPPPNKSPIVASSLAEPRPLVPRFHLAFNEQQPLFPVCNYHVCTHCRPTYKDRAWASIESAICEVPAWPPQHEILNRCISPKDVVAGLGTRAVPHPGFGGSFSEREMTSNYHSPRNYLTRQSGNWTLADYTDSEDGVTDATRQIPNRSRRSLRKSLKLALKSVVSNSRSSSRSRRSTDNNKAGATENGIGKKSTRKIEREMECEDGDVGLGRRFSAIGTSAEVAKTVAEQVVAALSRESRIQASSSISPEEDILNSAATKPLPDSDGRTVHEENDTEIWTTVPIVVDEDVEEGEVFDEGEVEVDDGVAVTEEAVGMGSADIIIHV